MPEGPPEPPSGASACAWADQLLADQVSFRKAWLAEGDKQVVPLIGPATPGGGEARLARRLSSGARGTGHDHVIACCPGAGRPGVRTVRVPADPEGILRGLRAMRPRGENWLAGLPDRSAALLVTDRGYALVAGGEAVLRLCVPEGHDRAVIDFKRYVRHLGDRADPAMAEAAGAFRIRQTAWASKREPTAGSGTAEQVSLREQFAGARISGPVFARSWHAARRRSHDRRERLRAEFERVLDGVFHALEDYAAEPALSEPGDLDDDGLRAVVRERLAALDSLKR
jgi:hypothetical protein